MPWNASTRKNSRRASRTEHATLGRAGVGRRADRPRIGSHARRRLHPPGSAAPVRRQLDRPVHAVCVLPAQPTLRDRLHPAARLLGPGFHARSPVDAARPRFQRARPPPRRGRHRPAQCRLAAHAGPPGLRPRGPAARALDRLGRGLRHGTAGPAAARLAGARPCGRFLRRSPAGAALPRCQRCLRLPRSAVAARIRQA